ncbi:uncharacterized protein LOC135499346 [Lineus longissimus]|uniref:uncharacterized protein LOC135499346 n=1 Tax=Lineus longissimus TaxID=88925 RepID=UPI00315CE73D
MVLPTVLKRRHSLRGVNLLPLVKRLRDVDVEQVKQFARPVNNEGKHSKTETLKNITPDLDTVTEESTEMEMEQFVSGLIDSPPQDIFELAEKEPNTSNWRLLVHLAIVYANEKGQPRGQQLVEPSTSDAPR